MWDSKRIELFPALPWRDWIRQHLPKGREGFVAEDLDLVTRVFSKDDQIGQFMLIEIKYGTSKLNESKLRTFGLIDQLLRTADPKGQRYLGFYVLQYYETPRSSFDKITVNGKAMTKQQLRRWLLGQLRVPPYEFPYYILDITNSKVARLVLRDEVLTSS